MRCRFMCRRFIKKLPVVATLWRMKKRSDRNKSDRNESNRIGSKQIESDQTSAMTMTDDAIAAKPDAIIAY